MKYKLFSNKIAKGLVGLITIVILLSSILATSIFYENNITANAVRESSDETKLAAISIIEINDIKGLNELNEGWYSIVNGYVFYLEHFDNYAPLYIHVANPEQQNGLIAVDEDGNVRFDGNVNKLSQKEVVEEKEEDSNSPAVIDGIGVTGYGIFKYQDPKKNTRLKYDGKDVIAVYDKNNNELLLYRSGDKWQYNSVGFWNSGWVTIQKGTSDKMHWYEGYSDFERQIVKKIEDSNPNLVVQAVKNYAEAPNSKVDVFAANSYSISPASAQNIPAPPAPIAPAPASPPPQSQTQCCAISQDTQTKGLKIGDRALGTNDIIYDAATGKTYTIRPFDKDGKITTADKGTPTLVPYDADKKQITGPPLSPDEVKNMKFVSAPIYYVDSKGARTLVIEGMKEYDSDNKEFTLKYDKNGYPYGIASDGELTDWADLKPGGVAGIFFSSGYTLKPKLAVAIETGSSGNLKEYAIDYHPDGVQLYTYPGASPSNPTVILGEAFGGSINEMGSQIRNQYSFYVDGKKVALGVDGGAWNLYNPNQVDANGNVKAGAQPIEMKATTRITFSELQPAPTVVPASARSAAPAATAPQPPVKQPASQKTDEQLVQEAINFNKDDKLSKINEVTEVFYDYVKQDVLPIEFFNKVSYSRLLENPKDLVQLWMSLQASLGLNPDGKVGTDTLNAIKKLQNSEKVTIGGEDYVYLHDGENGVLIGIVTSDDKTQKTTKILGGLPKTDFDDWKQKSAEAAAAQGFSVDKIKDPFLNPDQVQFEGISINDISNAEKKNVKYRFIEKTDDGKIIVEWDYQDRGKVGVVDGYDIIDPVTKKIISTIKYDDIDMKFDNMEKYLTDNQKRLLNTVPPEQRDYNFYTNNQIAPIVERVNNLYDAGALTRAIRSRQDILQEAIYPKLREESQSEINDFTARIADLLRNNKLTEDEYKKIAGNYFSDPSSDQYKKIVESVISQSKAVPATPQPQPSTPSLSQQDKQNIAQFVNSYIEAAARKAGRDSPNEEDYKKGIQEYLKIQENTQSQDKLAQIKTFFAEEYTNYKKTPTFVEKASSGLPETPQFKIDCDNGCKIDGKDVEFVTSEQGKLVYKEIDGDSYYIIPQASDNAYKAHIIKTGEGFTYVAGENDINFIEVNEASRPVATPSPTQSPQTPIPFDSNTYKENKRPDKQPIFLNRDTLAEMSTGECQKDTSKCVKVDPGQVFIKGQEQAQTPVKEPTAGAAAASGSLGQPGQPLPPDKIGTYPIQGKDGKLYQLDVFKPDDQGRQKLVYGGVEIEVDASLLKGVDFKKAFGYDPQTGKITVKSPTGENREIFKEGATYVAVDKKYVKDKLLTETKTEKFENGETKTTRTDNPTDPNKKQVTETTTLADGSTIEVKYKQGSDAITDDAKVKITAGGKTSEFSGTLYSEIIKQKSEGMSNSQLNQVLAEATRAGIKVDKVELGSIGDRNGAHIEFDASSIFTMNKDVVARQKNNDGTTIDYTGDVKRKGDEVTFGDSGGTYTSTKTGKDGKIQSYISGKIVNGQREETETQYDDNLIVFKSKGSEVTLDAKVGFDLSSDNYGKYKIIDGIPECSPSNPCTLEYASGPFGAQFGGLFGVYGPKVTQDGKEISLSAEQKEELQIIKLYTIDPKLKSLKQPTVEEFNSQRFFAEVERVFTEFQGLGYYSTLFFDEDSLSKWRDNVDKAFATLYLGTEYWSSKICGNYLDGENQGIAYAETPQGLAQVAAHIEATRSEQIFDENGNRFFIYKITFNVRNGDFEKDLRAPEKMNVNVVLHGEKTVNLFKQDQNIKRGSTFGRTGINAVVKTSNALFNEICLTFDEIPLRWKISDKKICNAIVESSGAPTSIQTAAPATSSSSINGTAAGSELNDI